MKKFFCLGILLVIAGAIVFGVGFKASGNNIYAMQTYTYNEVEFVCKEEVASIFLNDNNRHIIISYAEQENVTVKYSVSEKESYDVSEKDGNLNITRDAKAIIKLFSINFQRPYTRINVPYGKKVELNINSKNSAITIENINFVSVKIATSNASLNFKNSTIDGSVECKVDNAGIKLSDINAKSIKLEARNAGISCEDTIGEESISIVCSNGMIDADDIKSNDIFLQATNSRITCEIDGQKNDYQIKCTTKNGKSNLPSSASPPGYTKKLVVNNTNGSVKVEFSD